MDIWALSLKIFTMKSDETFEYGYRHGRQLSHFLVDVTSHGRDNLDRVLAIAFSDTVQRMKNATHFHTDGDRQLTLFVRSPKPGCATGAKPFPQPASQPQALDLVWGWLQHVQYPTDEHDGCSEKGWRVFNEQFGIVDECWEAFIAIRPMWIYFPK